jgi:hypothetical protein
MANIAWTRVTGDINWLEYGGEWMRINKDESIDYIKFINLHEYDTVLEYKYRLKTYYFSNISGVTSHPNLPCALSVLGRMDGDNEPNIYEQTEALVAYWNEGLADRVEGNNAHALFRQLGITSKLQ